MQWNEKELDAQFIPNVHFWTPNSEILPKAQGGVSQLKLDLNLNVSWT